MSKNFQVGLGKSSTSKLHVPSRVQGLHPHSRDVVSGKNLKQSHHQNLNQCKDTSIIQIQPNTTLSSNIIASNGSVDFNYRPLDIILSQEVLEYDITNNDASPSYEVQTLQVTENEATGSAYTGQLCFIFENEITYPVDESAGATEVNNAINSLPAMVLAGGCVVALTSGTIAAGTALFTVTFSTYGNKSQIYGISTLSEDTNGESCTIVSATSQAGTEGLKTTSYANISHVDYFNNTTSQVEVSLPRTVLMAYNLNYGRDAILRHRKMQNISSAYIPDVELMPGETKTFQLVIPSPFSVAARLPMNILNSDIRVRVHFSDGGVSNASGAVASDLAVSNASIWLYGTQLDAAEDNSIDDNKVKSFRGFDVREFEITKTFASGTYYDESLSGLNLGPCSHLIVLLRYNGGTGQYMHADAWEPITNMRLVDMHGKTAVQQIDANQIRHVFSGSGFENQDLVTEKNIYPLCFTDDVIGSLHGSQSGYFAFTGQERLQFTTGSALSQGSGSYTLSIIQFNYMFFDVDNGALKFTK